MSCRHTYAVRKLQRTIVIISHIMTNGSRNFRHIHCKRLSNILKLLTIVSLLSWLRLLLSSGMAMYVPGYRMPYGTISRNMASRFEPGVPAGRKKTIHGNTKRTGIQAPHFRCTLLERD